MRYVVAFLTFVFLFACQATLPSFESLSLAETAMEMNVGETVEITYDVKPENYTLEALEIQVDDYYLAREGHTITALREGATDVELWYDDAIQATLEITIHSTIHTVAFVGADIESVMVESNDRLPHDTTIPERDDAVFMGWFYDADLTRPFDYHTPVRRDLTLHARWIDENLVYNTENTFEEGPYKPGDRMRQHIIDADPEAGFNFPYVIYIPSRRYEEENLGYRRHMLLEGFNLSTYRNALHDDPSIDAMRIRNYYGSIVQERLFIPRITPLLPPILFQDTTQFDVDLETLLSMDYTDYHNHSDYAWDVIDTVFGYGYFMARLEDNLYTLVAREWDQVNEEPRGFSRDMVTPEDLEAYLDLHTQYLAMIDDARARLNDAGWNLEEEVFLKGFSASGMFVNRFTTMYPERVRAVFAAAFFYPVFPSDTLEDHTITYPLGTADYDELFGIDFDLEAYQEVPKLYYIATKDPLDTMYEHVYGYHLDQVAIVDDVIGEGHFLDRYEAVIKTYHELGGNAIFMLGIDMNHSMTSRHFDVVVRFFEIHRNHDGFHFDHALFNRSIEYRFPDDSD